MTNRRLKDFNKLEDKLRSNSDLDPDTYYLFLIKNYPNINNKKLFNKKTYVERKMPEVFFRFLQKFRRKNLKR